MVHTVRGSPEVLSLACALPGSQQRWILGELNSLGHRPRWSCPAPPVGFYLEIRASFAHPLLPPRCHPWERSGQAHPQGYIRTAATVYAQWLPSDTISFNSFKVEIIPLLWMRKPELREGG